MRRNLNQMCVEHIDAKQAHLVCGLDVPANITQLTFGDNVSKQNRFVPYRVATHPAPREWGDVCEFLINEEWVVCAYVGEVWWEEATRIGCGQTSGRGQPSPLSPTHLNANREAASKLATERGIERHRWFQKHSVPHTSAPVEVITPDGDVYFLHSKTEASQRFHLHRTMMCRHFNGELESVKGYKLRELPKQMFWGAL